MYKKAADEEMKSRKLGGSKTQKVFMAWFLMCCMVIFSATAVSAVSDSVIPDTGQALCYDGSGVEITCPAAGQPLAQDGSYSSNPPDYTDNLDGTVTDNVTTLLWEQPTANGVTIEIDATTNNITVSDTGNTFTRVSGSWTADGFVDGGIFVARGFADDGNNGIFLIENLSDTVVTVTTLAGGDPSLTDAVDITTTDLSFSNEQMTWAEAGDYCGSLLGAWRLPAINELNQIADYGTSDPAINGTYFPDIEFSTGSGYWSATESGLAPSSAMNIHFDTSGARIDGRDKTATNHVICVSGTGLTSSFVDNGATVSDNNLGLMWQESDDNAQRTWEAAISYCEGLSLGGYSDWRLPDIKEIQTIVDYSTYNPAVNTTFFPGTNSAKYWSSTTDDTFTGSAWTQRFSDGYAISVDKAASSFSYTRCVRENQIDSTPPETTIDTYPTNPAASTSATFTFSSDEQGSTFQCKMDAGAYATCTSPKQYTGLASGSHTFYVYATDPVGNPDLTPAEYTWTIDTTAPDLIITVLTVPATAAQGATIDVTDTTKNNGTKAVAAGATSTTRFYLSADNVLTPATDTLLGSRTVPGDLAIGATDIATTQLDIPLGQAAGTYYIIAKADTLDDIIESNETNNKKSATIKIGGDLIISALTVPATGGAGATIDVTDTTTNSGAGAIAASTTRFYLSTDSVLSPATDTLLGSRPVQGLAAGASDTSSPATTLTIPLGTTPGSYNIIAKADGPDLVDETDNGNNTKSTAIKIGPDLVVTVLTVPVTGGAGADILVTDTTKNSGAQAAVGTATRFYLSADSVLSPATDVVLGSRSVQGLAAGASDTSSPATTLTIPLGTAPGTYYIIAKADIPDVNVETTETNNTKSAVIKIGPDLVVTALTAPATGGAGATIDVTDTTKNSGGGSAGATTTTFYLSANTVLDGADIELGTRAIGALAAGASNGPATTTLDIPVGTASGNYYIIAKADGPGLVDETSNTNNTKNSTSIKIGGDLTVTVLTVPAAAAAGASVNAMDTTINSGGNAGASTTRFYLSSNSIWDALDTEIGGRAVPSLAAGASSASVAPGTSVTIPVGTTAGSYYIIAKADADAEVSETSETNNTKYAAIKIGGDLTITVLTVPATAAAGATISVTDTTKNAGAGDLVASKTKFYLSTDSVLSLATDTLLQPTAGRSVGALTAGSSSGPIITTVTIPAGTATGSYYIIAKADAGNLIAETSETNNTKSAAIKIGPDLAVSVLTAPATGEAGATISVSNTVLNSGGGSAGASTARFYLSANSVLDGADVSLGTRAVGALAAGGSNGAPATQLTIPGGTATGSYYLIAKADDGGVITEVSETNNTKYVAIKIGPDLTISVFTVPTTGTAGVAFDVTDTIKNNGGGASGASTTRFYRSANSVWDAGDIEIDSRAVGALAAGASNGPVTTSLTISAAGTYYIIAKTDADSVVTETIETNNTLARRIVVAP